MALEPGRKLAHFEIVEPLGAGAMGEVYLARDTKLGRMIAIKVLLESLLGDPERAKRFEQEAMVLASLDHPNIGALYDFRTDDGISYLAMQLVPGDTLEDMIERGRIPIEEALPLFAQIARGLEAAHERNIVHRDLKPANIKVTPEGQVKILDFGLAKSYKPVPDSGVRDSSMKAGGQKLTADGIIIGTPTYMSPEQARAKDVDRRTDIWAFGCTLFEALTGVAPFEGKTTADLIVRILREQPNWDLLPPDTPDSIRSLIRRCLKRDRLQRLKDAGDIAITLEEAAAAIGTGESEAVPTQGSLTAPEPSASPKPNRVPIFAAIAVVGAFAAVFFIVRGKSDRSPGEVIEVAEAEPTPTPTPRPVRRFSIGLSPEYPLKRPNPVIGDYVIALSPDGSTLVYVSGDNESTRLISRRLDELESHPIPGSDGAWGVFFSPDGQWLGYQERDNEPKLMKLPIKGGVPVPLADSELPMGGSWGRDGYITFGRNIGTGIWRVPADGGVAEQITWIDTDAGQIVHGQPQAIGDANLILYGDSGTPPSVNHGAFFLLDVGSRPTGFSEALGGYGKGRLIVENAGRVQYVVTGHFVFAREGALLAFPYDLDRRRATGPEVPITESRMATTSSIPRDYTFSEEGTLVYVPVTSTEDAARSLVWVDREGNETPVGAPERPYDRVRVSPDGKQLALDHTSYEDVWTFSLERGTTQRLTFNRATDYRPIWTPDSERVIFLSARAAETAIYSKRADGVGAVEHLVTNPEFPYPETITPDGKTLIFAPVASMAPVYSVTIGSDEEPKIILEGKFNERDTRISPDGKWISYESNETGQYEIYVLSFPELGAKWQISLAGGEDAVWNPDGTELFYWEGKKLMVVDVDGEPTFSAGEPKLLFEMPSKVAYDVAPDGQKFVVIRESDAPAWATELIVVENWFEELRRLAPPRPEGPQ